MKNILLLHPTMLFYKVRIYNKLSEELLKKGYNLIVWCNDIQSANETVLFGYVNDQMNIKNFLSNVRKFKIDVIINILSGISILPFYLLSMITAKLLCIKIIYYGHGLDLRSLGTKWKPFLQNFILLLFDGILLYTPNEKKYLWKRHHEKIVIAYNTLVLSGYDELVHCDKKVFKEKYGIIQDKIILFCGRIQPRKRLDILLKMFLENKAKFGNVALLIIGPGLSVEDEKLSEEYCNIYYLGAVYEERKLNEIFFMSDIFCIPGQNGLGLVEAMYWGKPVFTMPEKHGPEIYYLKNGKNGYLVKNENLLCKEILNVLYDGDLYSKLSVNARRTAVEEASLERMFNGFFDILSYC